MPNDDTAVNVHKTSSDVVSGTAKQGPSPKTPPDSAAAKTGAVKAVPLKPAAVKPPPAALPRLAQPAAGTPWPAQGDKLSASIISFARFFSLSLKPEVTAAIRRQAFAPAAAPPQPDQSAGTAPEAAAKRREALSLAAAASLGKGVELTPRALESYAAAIDPEWFAVPEKRDGQGRRHKRHDGRGDARTPPAGTAGHKSAGDEPPAGPITASQLKEMALEAEAGDPLLATLNRLPGKNGRRWIVLPFTCGRDGEFRVSMRVLLEGEGRASRMVLDVCDNSSQRWVFAADWQGGALSGLSVFVQPEQSPQAHALLALDLSRHIEIPAGRISVGNYPGSFPGESPCVDDPLQSIDEVV